MDFLNEQFRSLDDLKRTDTLIGELNREREDIENAVLRRNEDEDQSDDVFEEIRIQSQQISTELNIIVEKAINNNLDLQDAEIELENMVSVHGDLKLFREVLAQLEEVDQLKKSQNLVGVYNSLHRQVSELATMEVKPSSVIQSLKELDCELRHFEESAVASDLKVELMQNIQQEVSRLVVMKFKPEFEIYDSDIPTIGQLKDLVELQSLDPLNKTVKPLWAVECMIQKNFALKFKFHYDSNAETNKLDKPEWVFKFVRDWLSSNFDELAHSYSQILQNTSYETESFKEHYAAACVALLENKIAKNIRLIFQLGDESVLMMNLIHLIEEILKNDDFFMKTFKINVNMLDKYILSNDEITKKWLEFETTFNFAKYQDITSKKDAFLIDFESVDRWATKPTNSSILVKNLLDNLNLKYKLIKNMPFKLKLLTQIQLRIMERYYERLEEALNAFNSLFKKFKLLSNKSEEENLIVGVSGIDRLLRIYCSLKYMIETMEIWNEDLLFIQLSRRINEDTFFETLIESYHQLSKRVLAVVHEFLNREINSSFKRYFRLSNWSKMASFDHTSTVELSQGLHILSEMLSFLCRALSEIDLIPVLTGFEERIVKFFSESILNLNTFTVQGALQLRHDFNHTIEELGLFKNFKDFIQMDELLKFLTVVSRSTVDNMNYTDYDEFYRLCDEQNMIALRKDPKLAYSVGRRKVFHV